MARFGVKDAKVAKIANAFPIPLGNLGPGSHFCRGRLPPAVLGRLDTVANRPALFGSPSGIPADNGSGCPELTSQ
jgi:hypothetical protein